MVEGFAESPVTQEELDRAKTQWLKAWDQQFTNPEAIGVALSDSIAQGDWRLFFLLRRRIRPNRAIVVGFRNWQHRTLRTFDRNNSHAG